MIKKDMALQTITSSDELIDKFYLKYPGGVSIGLGRKLYKGWNSGCFGFSKRYLVNTEDKILIEWQGELNRVMSSNNTSIFVPLFELKNPTFNTYSFTQEEIEALPYNIQGYAESANGNYNPNDENGFIGGQIGFFCINSRINNVHKHSLYCTVTDNLTSGTRQTLKICDEYHSGMPENYPEPYYYNAFFTTLIFQITYDESDSTLTIECSSTGGDTWETPVVFSNIATRPVGLEPLEDDIQFSEGVVFRPYPDSCTGIDLTIDTGASSANKTIDATKVNTIAIKGQTSDIYDEPEDHGYGERTWDDLKAIMKEDAKRYYYEKMTIENIDFLNLQADVKQKPVLLYYSNPIIIFDSFDCGNKCSDAPLDSADLGQNLEGVKTLELNLRLPSTFWGDFGHTPALGEIYSRPFWAQRESSSGADRNYSEETYQLYYNLVNFRNNQSDKYLQTYIGITGEPHRTLPIDLSVYQQQKYGETAIGNRSMFSSYISPSIVLCLNGTDYYAPLVVSSYLDSENEYATPYTSGSLPINDYHDYYTYTTTNPPSPNNNFTYRGSTGSLSLERTLPIGIKLEEKYQPKMVSYDEYDVSKTRYYTQTGYDDIIITWSFTINSSNNKISFYLNGNKIGEQSITSSSVTLGKIVSTNLVYPSFTNDANNVIPRTSKYKNSVIQMRAYTTQLSEQQLKKHAILDQERAKYIAQRSIDDDRDSCGFWIPDREEDLIIGKKVSDYGTGDFNAYYPYWVCNN